MAIATPCAGPDGRRGRRSAPCSRTLPCVGRSSPTMTFSSVLLPAPFGPTTATMSPSSIPNVTPSTAGRPPKRFVTASTSRSRCAPPGLRAVGRQRLRRTAPSARRWWSGVQPRSGGAPWSGWRTAAGLPSAHPMPSTAAAAYGMLNVWSGRTPRSAAVDSDVADRLRDDLHVRVAGERVVLEELVLRERPQVALREGLVLLVPVAMHLKSLQRPNAAAPRSSQ